MRFTRKEKSSLVDAIRQKFESSDAAFIAEYKGIKAVDMNEIRKALRSSDVEFKVVRNTLARRAVSGTTADILSGHMAGPVALIFSYKDAAKAARKLTEFAKDQPNLKVKIGAMRGRLIGPAEIKGLSELPPREVLLAKLLGSMMSPVAGIARVLSALPRNLVYALRAIEEKKAAAHG